LVNNLFIFIIRFFFLHKDSSSDQPSPIEQQAVDQTEDDRQEIVPSSRPTNMHFQKQPSPIVNCNEGPFKQNTE
jgi:hypothetical protein